jgi:hypothetical protein
MVGHLTQVGPNCGFAKQGQVGQRRERVVRAHVDPAVIEQPAVVEAACVGFDQQAAQLTLLHGPQALPRPPLAVLQLVQAAEGASPEQAFVQWGEYVTDQSRMHHQPPPKTTGKPC